MSYPPHRPSPPPYYPPHSRPAHHGAPYPPQHHGPPYPPHHRGPPHSSTHPHGPQQYPHGYPMPYYMPAMMVPVPYAQPETQPTYVTNYIYHGETVQVADSPAITDQVQVVECSGDYDWVPTTSTLAGSLTGRAVVGGHEGWDGSPLWVIRAWHNAELIPGKLSVRHNSATIPYNGKEVPVQNIEVLCCEPQSLRWVPASSGNVPPSAIPGGHTLSGEQIFIGRARHQLSLTPGKVQSSTNACYISFAGSEVAHKMYDVLCRNS